MTEDCRNTGGPGISVSGVGNRIAHNLIHHGPRTALSAGGNNPLLEFNEIHNVVEDSGDAGAYDVGRDWTQRGNLLRWNHWHDIAGSTGYGGREEDWFQVTAALEDGLVCG